MEKYILLVQNTTTKEIHHYYVEDDLSSKLYYHFEDVDLSELETGEHRYFLYETPENIDEPIFILQNDPRVVMYSEDTYVLVSGNKLLTAEDVILVIKGEEYQVQLCCVASGLIKVGSYKADGKQYDLPKQYKQYKS